MNVPLARATLALVALTAAPGLAQEQKGDSLVKYWITPAATDSSIRRFNEPHYIVFERSVRQTAPLLVFMPGTGGKPERTTDFANVAARRGYRVIGLAYVDTPAVMQRCPRDPDTKCSEKFRQKRIFGDDVLHAIDDRPEESIVNRLVKLLSTLHREHPTEGWDAYLDNNQPRWNRIAVSGLSQGAGMAAFIAQKKRVERVILFSSPWDSYGRQRTLASWILTGPGATPPERWFGVYHEKEPTAALIAAAYAALRIPSKQTRVFKLEPVSFGRGEPQYHPSVVGNGVTPRRPDGTPAYLDEWIFLLGDMR